MTTLLALLGSLDDLDPEGVLYAARPWTYASQAECVRPDGEGAAHGFTYLLEVSGAIDVAVVWSAWRDGRTPTTQELADAVIHYAEHDSYLPLEPDP